MPAFPSYVSGGSWILVIRVSIMSARVGYGCHAAGGQVRWEPQTQAAGHKRQGETDLHGHRCGRLVSRFVLHIGRPT